MDRQLRGSLPSERSGSFYKNVGAKTPGAKCRRCAQLAAAYPDAGRAGFTDEPFARFLTAEQLVLDAGDIAALSLRQVLASLDPADFLRLRVMAAAAKTCPSNATGS